MFREYKKNAINNEKGFGLLAAIFVIVVVAMFGMLIVRYTISGATSSVDDYLWAQALYSAESAAQLRILDYDNGGTGTFALPLVINQSTTNSIIDDFTAPATPATLRITATRLNITREIEIKYLLQ
ncbi:MAG: hypothetical protein KAJ45_01080 [Desulfobulbaceae bacterium]|nr:hypothetical protein [Desulfobulbaceae bacterium]